MISNASLSIREWMQPVEGAELFVRAVGGYDGGPVLLLAHGGPGLLHDYLKGLEALASETLRVVLWDQRGLGRSTGEPTRGNPIAEYAEDLEALRRALGVEQISVLGHSAGGFNAVAYGSAHPEWTASIIFVDSIAATAQDLGAAFGRQQARIAALQDEGVIPRPLSDDFTERLAAITPAYFADPRRPDLAANLAGTSANAPTGGAIMQAMGDYDLRPLLSRLTMPVLNVICEIPFGIEMATSVADVTPPERSRNLVLAGCSHFPWIERPERFYPEVRAFLAGVDDRAEAPSASPVA